MNRELFGIDDPALAQIREAAHRTRPALAWLMDSARQWARDEFYRREFRRLRNGMPPPTDDPDALERRLRELLRHQVAVLTGHREMNGSLEHTRVMTGFMRDATHEYVDIELGDGRRDAGMQRVVDIIELPPAFRVRRWPTE